MCSFGRPELDWVANANHRLTVVLEEFPLHIDDPLVNESLATLLSDLGGKTFDILFAEAFPSHEQFLGLGKLVLSLHDIERHIGGVCSFLKVLVAIVHIGWIR